MRSITADVTLPEKAEGMVVTQDGLMGGYGLYFKEGKPTFVYNMISLERPTFSAKAALPAGKTTIIVELICQGRPGEIGKGATVKLSSSGTVLAEGEIKRTVPAQSGLGEGLDIGSPVDFTYDLPFLFTGKIEKVNRRVEMTVVVCTAGGYFRSCRSTCVTLARLGSSEVGIGMRTNCIGGADRGGLDDRTSPLGWDPEVRS